MRKVDELIARALPQDWSTRLERESAKGQWPPDAILRIAGPDGATATYVIEAKPSVTPQSLLKAVEQLDTYIRQSASTTLLPLIAAPYLSARSKELLAERGISDTATT